MKIDVRSKESVYITINEVTYYIDDSTNEQIVEIYAEGGKPHDLSTQEGRDTYVKASSKPNKYMAKRKYDEMGNFLGYYAEGGEIEENNGDITVAENKIKDLEFYPNYDAEIIEVGLGKKRVDAQIFFDADGRDYILINDKINYVDDLEISSTYAGGGEISDKIIGIAKTQMSKEIYQCPICDCHNTEAQYDYPHMSECNACGSEWITD
jgi:hypothetical protein